MNLSHFRLLVPDVCECFTFYRDIIGLKVLHGNEETPYAEFQTGNINLALEPLMGNEPPQVLREHKDFSIHDRAALIFKVDNVDSVYDQLRSKHVEFVKKPHDTPEWGHRVAYLRDPAGTLIELNQGL
ncbi:VOC family protein [Paenibacillus sp. 22594]|uniref:VOC family protein n=1 Tax=Paenibacillus sp. 22594 TaxID=3453947 RepID=UPI003F87E5C0